MTVSYKKKDKKIKIQSDLSENRLIDIFKDYNNCYISE